MKENDSKEINLIDIILGFFRWLKKLGWSILILLGNSLRILFRNKVLTCIILTLSIALGIYSGRPSNREYRAEAMAILNGSLAQTVREASLLLATSSGLSNFTTLPENVTNNITEIASFYVIDFLNDSTPDMVDFKHKHSWQDTLNVRMPNRLYFRIKTRDVSEIPVFQEAFLNYFNTNSRLLGEFNAKKNNLSQEIHLLNSEINRLDSMANISYFRGFTDQQIQFKRNTLLVGEQKKHLLYTDFLLLQKLKLKREVEFINCTEPVVLPTGFIVNGHYEAGYVEYVLIYSLIGFIVSILLSLLIEHRKCILDYLSKK